MHDKNLLKPKEAASILKIKVSTLTKWRRLKVGPPYIRLNQTNILYGEMDLYSWIDSKGVK